MGGDGRTWGSKLPERLAARVAAELQPGEEIVWVGRPRRELSYANLSWSRMSVVFVLALAGSVLTLAADGALGVVGAVVAGCSWFLVIGGLALPRLWRLGVVQRNFYYLVTTRRAIVCCRLPLTAGVQLRSFSPAELAAMVCVERADGSGDLRFDGDSERPAALNDGFITVDDVRAVERVVRDTLGPNRAGANSPAG